MKTNRLILKCCLVGYMVSFCFAAFAQQVSIMKNANISLHKRMVVHPLVHLPSNMHVLTLFGERADISHDNTRVAFNLKTFGDARVVDIKTIRSMEISST